MIAVMDYGLGNCQAIENIYRDLDIRAKAVMSATELEKAEKVILPGVGSFDWAMERLSSSGMMDVLCELVLDKKIPVLGICIGMHLMGRKSEEGQALGLGWIDAEAKKMTTAGSSKMRLPHMGWNEAPPCRSDPLFSGLNEPRYYFLHSYCMVPHDNEDILAVTDYHGEFSSALQHGHIRGVQFHPEKSHHWGVTLLRNFAKL